MSISLNTLRKKHLPVQIQQQKHRRSGVFIVNFEHINTFVCVFIFDWTKVYWAYWLLALREQKIISDVALIGINSLKMSPRFITNEYDFYLLKYFCIEVLLKIAQCFVDTC